MWTKITDHAASLEPGAINTCAIQNAIDACHLAGGGTVVCPAGVWHTGSIWLKSNVTLHLEAGCTLRAGADRRDYNPEPAHEESAAFGFENVTDHHLVLAYRASNIAITGRGTIDGNSRAFLPLIANEKWKRNYEWRPGQMIYFCRCEHVLVENVRLLNSPYWTLFLHGCNDVVARGLTIINPDETPNGDGIDIDCCQNVRVEGCHISTGDDSITLRAHIDPLKAPQPCRHVTVTNCVLHSTCNGIRIGVGNGVIEQCSLSNIVMHECATGIDLVSRYSDKMPGPGATIRQIRLADMIIDAQKPWHVCTGVQGNAPVEQITFEGITAIAHRASFAGGAPDNPVRHLTFRNIDLTVRGGEGNQAFCKDYPSYPPGAFGQANLPAVMCLSDVADAAMENWRVRFDHPGGPWDHALAARRAHGLSLQNINMKFPDDSRPDQATRFDDCKDVEHR